MSINNFIPQVWAGQVLLNLHKSQIWAQPGVANRDYTGTIAGMGDTVRINAIGAITISSYTKNTQLSSPQILTDASSVLAVDQGDTFNFLIDDVDKAQQMPKVMATAMWEAAYGLSDKMDKFIATTALGSTSSANTIGTDASPKADLAVSSQFTKAVDYLIDLGVLLDQANVPRGNRWAIVPPFYYGLMQRDLRFTGYNTPRADDILSNGIIGSAAGFTLSVSNNNPLSGASSNVYNIIAGYPGAITVAEQITETEALRNPLYFGDQVRGLHVYGAKVTRPQGIAILKCSDPGF